MSWFKKKNPREEEEEASRTSHERPLPRDDHDDVVTERTRLLGQTLEPDVQPSPYNLAVVRSLRNISIFPQPHLTNLERYILNTCNYRMVDCSIRVVVRQCPRPI